MRALWVAVLLAGGAALAQGTPNSEIRLDYSNPKLIPAQWTLILRPNGSGHFHAERGNAPPANPETMEPQMIDRDVQLSGQFAGRIFRTIQEHPLRQGHCESRNKVAFQGLKTLEYRGPLGTESCTFNFAKDRDVGAVTDSLISVAATLIEGERLTMIWQHDPLGLDHEIQFMTEAAADGRLQQLCAIRDTLEKLAADPGVMERVRRRAGTLSQCSR